MFCSEVLSDDLHIYHVSLCVYVIRCLCFHSCCYKNTCVRVDEAWGCPAHKNKSNVRDEVVFYFLWHLTGNLLLWLIENASYPSWHSPPAPGRWLCGRRPAWCRRPGWRTWGRQWWSPVCLLKPGEKKKTKKRGIKQTSTTTTAPPSVCFLFPPHLRELSVSKPLQPPHAVAGLPLAGGAPRHHDAGPPGEALDFPPHQLADAETLVVLEVRRQREWGWG